MQSCDINAEVARGGAAADMRDGTFQSTQMGRSLAGGVTGAAFSRVSVYKPHRDTSSLRKVTSAFVYGTVSFSD